MQPLVSIIIATKDAAHYLAECLDAVAAQSHQNYEILMVDANSADGTREIAAQSDRLRIIDQVGTGFEGAWNEGIAAARGDYLAFVDSDDRWTPQKLELQVAALENDPQAMGAIGKVRFFLEEGETPPPGFRDRVFEGEHMASMPGVLMARPQLFDIMGPWEERWSIVSDIEWFVRLRDLKVPMVKVDQLLLHKRVHGGNLSYVTASKDIYPKELLKTLHESIQRKRQAAQSNG